MVSAPPPLYLNFYRKLVLIAKHLALERLPHPRYPDNSASVRINLTPNGPRVPSRGN